MSFFIENAASISLLFFFAVFVVIAFRAYRPSARKELQEHALIPLREEE